ncbi:SEC-C metal-binding domain-containing protein, partial [Pontiella sp.]
DLMDRIYEEIANSMFRSGTSIEAIEDFFRSLSSMQVRHPQASALAAASAQAQRQPQNAPPPGMGQPMGAPPPGMDLPQAPAPTPIRKAVPKAGRNDPCPCGSGRKYKKCCGAE